MPYPRELNLDEYTEQRLRSYITEELNNHYAERGNYIEDILRGQASYWAEPDRAEVMFPFRGASNIVIPLNAIAVEAIHARTMTTLFGLPQFVSVKATDPDWQQISRPFERYMDNVLLRDVKVRKQFGDICLELEKFGTGVGKAGYTEIVKYAVRDLGDGKEEEVPVTIKKGPVLDPVSGARYLMPFSSQDAQTAPWCGEEHTSSPFEIRMLEESGLLKPGTFDKIGSWVNTLSTKGPTDEGNKNQAELEKRVPVWPKTIDWVELWMTFNVDGNDKGRNAEIVVLYHRESETFMSIRYNWHTDLRRPYRKGNYMPLEHRWNGIGICKQNDMFQEEITAMHRSQLDNSTLANMRMIKVSRLSGYGPDEPIFPGKIWILDDMDYVDSVQMSEIYPSSYNSEQSTLLFSQQRTGVNEVTLGMPQVGTPGTATSDLSRIQEGNKKFGFMYGNIKELADELVIDIACCIQQFGPKNVDYWDNMEGGDGVRQVFQLPESYIRDGVILEIKASGQQENKLTDRQNLQQVAQMYQQFIQSRVGLLQLALGMGIRDPQLFKEFLDTIITGYQGSAELMQQIFETFDIRNIDRILKGTTSGVMPNAGQNGTGGLPLIAGVGATPQMGNPSQISTPMQGGNT
jgi:hypothetical protein